MNTSNWKSANNVISINTINKCKYDVVQIGEGNVYNDDINFLWIPSTGLTSNNISNPYTTTTNTTQYNLIIYNNYCQDTITQKIEINDIYADVLRMHENYDEALIQYQK